MADDQEVFRMKVTISAHETPELHARLLRAKEGRTRSALLKQLAQVQVLYPYGGHPSTTGRTVEPAATADSPSPSVSGLGEGSDEGLDRASYGQPQEMAHGGEDMSSLLSQSSFSKYL